MKKDVMINAITGIDEKYLIEYTQYETKLEILRSRKQIRNRSLLVCAACLTLVFCMLLVSLPLSFIVLRSEPARELGNQVIENVLFPLDKEQVEPDDPDAPISPEQEKLILNWIEWEITENTFTALGAGTPQSKIDVLKSVEGGWFDEFLNRLGVLLERMYDYYLRHKKEIDEIIGLPESSEDTTDIEQTTYPDEETTVPDEDTTEVITDDTTTEPDEQTTPPEPRDYTDEQNVMYRTSDDVTYWIVLGRTEEAKKLTQEDYKMFTIVIPESIDGIPVKEVQEYAFYQESYLTDVTFPEGLEIIGQWAFSETRVKNLVLPSTLVTMGEDAFSHGIDLKSITILGGIKELPQGAFYNCKDLQEVVLYDGITSIGLAAFERCTRLESIQLPESVEIIGERAFMGCDRLTEIRLPSNLKTLEMNAFRETGSLMLYIEEDIGIEFKGYLNITIPDGIDILKEGLFFDSCLESITIPHSVTEIEWGVFGNCRVMNEIIYHGTVEEWNAIVKNERAFGIYEKSSFAQDYELRDIRVVCTDGEVIEKQIFWKYDWE